MPQSIIILRFKDDDLSSVYELVRNTIDISYSTHYSEKAIELFKEYHTRESILADARNGYTLVALEYDKIVGTGTLLGANIRRVFISPLYQHKGIGTIIVDELEKKAAADNRFILDLSAALGSRTFWELRGFIIQEELFLPAGKDWIIRYYSMIKTLDSVE